MFVKSNRSVLKYIILTVITLGLYGLWDVHALARDVNTICEGDGKHTNGLIMCFLLSMITCGIYVFVWHCGIGNRLYANAPRYNKRFSEDGKTVLLWMIVGSFVVGIGSLVAMHIIFHNTNTLAECYNRN